VKPAARIFAARRLKKVYWVAEEKRVSHTRLAASGPGIAAKLLEMS
jgi:hypothetical protein